MSKALEIQSKTVSEVRNLAASFVGKLDVGENLTSVLPPAEVSSSDLSFSNIGVSIIVLTINGNSVPIGRAVQFSVSGGIAGKRYEITITASSDAAPAQTLTLIVTLNVAGD